MPITFDARSFVSTGRRIALAAAGVEYAALDPGDRLDRLRTLAALGFNTVLASCPWMLHEPVPGRFDFDGRLDVGGFLDEAHAVGLRVILRIGPAIGSPFDGSGLPPWLVEVPDLEARAGSPAFMERVAAWYGTLAERLVPRQADRDGGGPLLAIQIEHDWQCGAATASQAYLSELLRYARERGFTIPVLTANGFWAPVEGAIETWSGWDDLFANVRQLVTIQPGMPRLCVVDRSAEPEAFIRPGRRVESAAASEVAGRVGRVIAAGGLPIVAHAVAGAFPAGAIGVDDHGAISSSPFASPLVDETGRPTDRGLAVSRLARFVRDFAPLVADLDPDDTPLVVDPEDRTAGVSVVPRRGGLGDLVFAFRRGDGGERATLVDGEGRRVSIDFGRHEVAWRVFDADLAGRGRLDFASATPLALLGGRLLVLSAPARSTVELSIDGRPLEVEAPSVGKAGSKPVVVEHAGFTVAVVADETSGGLLDVEDGVVIGATAIDADGATETTAGTTAWRIGIDGTLSRTTPAGSSSRRRRAKGWSVWREPDPLEPSHPRSIPFDGSLGLATMGAGLDHAWLAAPIRLSDAKARTLRFLGGLGDARVWLDGSPAGPVEDGVMTLKAGKGDHRLGLFIRHRRRHVDGLPAPMDGDRPGALVAVKPLAGVKRSTASVGLIDPFTISGFVPGAADGERTAGEGVVLSFTHRRRSPVLLEIEPGAAGVVLLNDEPVATFGRTGLRRSFSSAEVEAFKAGANRIAIVPFEHVVESGIEPAVSLLEVVEELVPADGWRVRRWEAGPDPRVGHWESPAPRSATTPRWIRGTFPAPPRDHEGPIVLELDGLVRGRVRMGEVDLGGYDVREPGGRAAAGADGTRLSVPRRLATGAKVLEIDILDESGADPAKVAIRF